MLLRQGNCLTPAGRILPAGLCEGGEGRDLWRSAASPALSRLTRVGVHTRLLKLWAQLQLLNQ